MTITAIYQHIGGHCIRTRFVAYQGHETGHSNWALNTQTGHSSDDSKQCPVSGNSAQLVRSFSQTGHCPDPHKQADAEASVPSSVQFLQHVDTTRAHINLTTTRAQETAQPENTALPGTTTPPTTEHANEPQTFAASQRTQEPRRWRIWRRRAGGSYPWLMQRVDIPDCGIGGFSTWRAAINWVAATEGIS